MSTRTLVAAIVATAVVTAFVSVSVTHAHRAERRAGAYR
jgi:hypothetical protein